MEIVNMLMENSKNCWMRMSQGQKSYFCSTIFTEFQFLWFYAVYAVVEGIFIGGEKQKIRKRERKRKKRKKRDMR